MEYIQAIWLFILQFTQTAPVGVWTFFVAAICPAVMMPFFRKALPETMHERTADFLAESVALVAGIVLAYGLWPEFKGLVLGIVAGFMSPYLTKGWQMVSGMVFRYIARKLGDNPHGDTP